MWTLGRVDSGTCGRVPGGGLGPDNVDFGTCGIEIEDACNRGVVDSDTCGLGGAQKELVSST